jgi:hypothetical protein
MKQHELARAVARAVCITGAFGLAGAGQALAADDVVLKNGLSTPDALNMVRLGHNDMQNRPIYQPTVHKYPASTAATGTSGANAYAGKTILFAGLHNATGGGGCVGSLPNPLNGNQCEKDGTLIVDVTTPSNPVVIKHLPPANPNNAMAQMVRACDGQTGKLGQTGHVYMLRSDGAGGGNGQHDVYDVTDPVNPVLLSVPASGLTSTHKSWWECDTGIAYLVVGANTGAVNPDGWNTNQHIRIYDLSDPANPVYIRDIGLLGQNPGSQVTTATSGVHGPQSVITNPVTGELINRVYVPYGTSSNGVMQIDDRLKILPDFTTSAGQHIAGTWTGFGTSRAQSPTDDDLRDIVVGSMDMTPTEGAHSTCPVYNTTLKHFKGFTSYTTRDYVQLISEETGNRCSGAPHFGYMVDATRSVGAGAASSGEQHPMVVSTMQVFEDSAKPDYCTRGTRFGTHSCNESLASIPSTFFAPDFGKLTYIAYFDGGARAFDIRDPYHPQDVAHYVPAVHALPFGEQPPNMVNGNLVHDVSSNNLDQDSNGLIYDVDRVGYGLDILMLTGPAAQIRTAP